MPKHFSKKLHCDIAIIGAGIVGISAAFYIKKQKPDASVLLIESGQAMALTSAQSGENYRNWWPHPAMTAFTERSISLMEDIARETANRIQMNRRGYVLSTRSSDIDVLMSELYHGYSCMPDNQIRVHETAGSTHYQKPVSPDWETAPSGVDVIKHQPLIRQTFPSYAQDIQTVVHVRRAGSISAQQMGQYMLDYFKEQGGTYVSSEVIGVEKNNAFIVYGANDSVQISAAQLINAAGPFINDIAGMLGTSLPVTNTLQQKIAFEDKASVIPRDMPFSIDLDPQHIDWTEEERHWLSEDCEHDYLLQKMPGAIHCRPDGGDNGTWIKLGWAFNDTTTMPERNPDLLAAFPEIVLRGAARLNPSLKTYYGRLPRSLHHYGGCYTLTEENWPLIGPMSVDGSYVVGAMSGFGTMGACAAGEQCARQVLGQELSGYAKALSPERYSDRNLMSEIHALNQRGIL